MPETERITLPLAALIPNPKNDKSIPLGRLLF